MNKNKYIASHHYHSGDTEILNFEEFKKLLIEIIDFEIKIFKSKDKEDEKICRSLKCWRRELYDIKEFEELLNFYKNGYFGIDLFDYIDINTSAIYELKGEKDEKN